MYVLSERVLQHTYAIPTVAISIPTDPTSIIEGRRLATVRGCFGGCHGKQAEGTVLFDQPMIGCVVAPNLTAAVRKYSDSELAAIIRNGVRPGGRSLVVMPSEAFVALTDGDVGRIIAFLRSSSVAGPGPSISLGPIGRVGILMGKFKLASQLIAEATPPPEATNEEGAYGRYLARTTCAECHGTHLRGTSTPAFKSADLRVVAAYSPEALLIIANWRPARGKEARYDARDGSGPFVVLTDAEIDALYSYLHAMLQ